MLVFFSVSIVLSNAAGQNLCEHCWAKPLRVLWVTEKVRVHTDFWDSNHGLWNPDAPYDFLAAQLQN